MKHILIALFIGAMVALLSACQTGPTDPAPKSTSVSNQTGTANTHGVAINKGKDKKGTSSLVVGRIQLSVSVVGGTYSVFPNGPYDDGDVVTVTVHPYPYYNYWQGWKGDVISDDNPVTIVMDESKSIYCECSPELPSKWIVGKPGGHYNQ